MSDIFQEVQEEVRKDQYAELWKKYGLYIIAVVAVIVAIVVGNQALNTYETSQRQSAGAALFAAEAALAAGDVDGGLGHLSTLAEEGSSNAALLAELRAAAALQEAGRQDEALARFDAVAIQAGGNITLRDLAALKAAMIAMDTASAADVQSRLSDLTVAGAPYRLSALELSAVLHIQTGDVAAAQEKLETILADPATSSAMADRVQILLAQTGA